MRLLELELSIFIKKFGRLAGIVGKLFRDKPGFSKKTSDQAE